MNGLTEGLWIASGVNAIAALALSTIGRRRMGHVRGWRLWQAGSWTSAGGVGLVATFGHAPVVLPIALLLTLQGPFLSLIGMRHFHARIDWPGTEQLDWWCFVICAMLVAVSGLFPPDSAAGGLVAPIGLLMGGLYAACILITAGSAGRGETRPMLVLAGIVAASALLPAIVGLGHSDVRALVQVGAASASMASVATAFIVTTLAFDRNERHLLASRRRLRALASIDPLTQVPNRRHFEELAAQALSHDPPASAVLMMFDVDHFKRINDQLGHAGGDRALRLVSRCVREVLRVQDVPCRHGGDEFALLLRHASVHEAMRVAARLVHRVQSLAAGSDLPMLSLSFGVVQIRPAELLPQALQRADQALYEAKRQGRSRAVAAGGTDARAPFTESRPLGLTAA